MEDVKDKKSKQYRCSRCHNIFKTHRVYTSRHGAKICDKCIKVNPTHMNQYWCYRCERLFRTKRKYKSTSGRHICDRCIKPKGGDGKGPRMNSILKKYKLL